MKKIYQKPEVNVMHVEHQCLICQSVNDAESNIDLHYRGAGHGESRVKDQGGYDDWYDDWDD